MILAYIRFKMFNYYWQSDLILFILEQEFDYKNTLKRVKTQNYKILNSKSNKKLSQKFKQGFE